MWTNADLLKEFNRLNKKYFDGKLVVSYVAFGVLKENEFLGHTTTWRTSKRGETLFSVRISRKIRGMRNVWLVTLIHEMVHVEQCNKYTCGHGKVFNRRMRELAAAGAFDGIW